MQSNRRLIAIDTETITPGMDFSQMEYRIRAVLSQQGSEETMEDKKRNLSQMYGTQKDEIRKMLGSDEAQRKLTLETLKEYPNFRPYMPELRKLKSKAMLEALRFGHYDSGNHFMTCYGYVFHFFYRGTLIFKWDAVEDIWASVYAGEYEDTASTRNQRKEILKAIENFREAVIGV